jgi:hypothetical protein
MTARLLNFWGFYPEKKRNFFLTIGFRCEFVLLLRISAVVRWGAV